MDPGSDTPKWIVMECAQGGTLEQYVAQKCSVGKGLDLGDIVDVAVDVLEGLAHLHSLEPDRVVMRCVGW